MPTTANPALATPPHVTLEESRAARLRRFNLVMGGLHAVSATLMVALGNDFSLDVSSFSLNGPPGTPVSEGEIETVFSVRLAWFTAAFLYLSALFHVVIASPLGFPAYADELRRGRNRFRWVEYSLSATLMIVLIALITGITDLAALIAIAFVNASMILFGWIMEMANRIDGAIWWTPFWFGCVAGAAPWIAIATYLAVNIQRDGAESPPTFVWGILVSIFVLFNVFAVNQFLQYRQIGPWKDYIVGEISYIVLSLTAKTVLAWQIFANTLID